jgi:hypothetical protein
MTMIGTSLSNMGGGANSLASRVQEMMGWQPGEVVNAASDGYQIGDLFAELIGARRAGSSVALIELNPYAFNERQRTNAPLPEGSVTLNDTNAISILPHVSLAVRWQIARQFGVEGAMSRVVSDFAPSRIRDSHLMKELALSRKWLFGLPPPKPARFVRDEKARARAREFVCRNFCAKNVEGIDLEVYEDLLAWASSRQSKTQVLLFVWPLNRKMIADCGADALDRANAVVGKLVEEARRSGVPIADLSHALDGREYALWDYGHLENPGYFALWEPALAQFLRRSKIASLAVAAFRRSTSQQTIRT